MIPNKLKKGDEIRVISPSRSLGIIAEDVRDLALETLSDLGFHVTFSKHAAELDEFASSSIESRVEDIHEAFRDPNVKGILTTIGGYNSNQLLRYLDYELIKDNPKILCGYSDITALSNAIYRKAGLVTYSGPHFSTFGMKKGIEYTKTYFMKCLTSNEELEIIPSETWSDDIWYLNQEDRTFYQNQGPVTCNIGDVEGTIIGGNLGTFNLLQGTEFMPSLKNSILFLEDTEAVSIETFDRDLQSLIHLPDFKNVKGLVIGRFQTGSKISIEQLVKVVKAKKELSQIPLILNLDFGHTTPIFTFPVGGNVRISASENISSIIITEY